MKPFKILKEAKDVLSDLTFELKYSKDKDKQAKRLNKLIKALNCLDGLLVYKYKTDALNITLYSLIYEWFNMFGVGNGNDIPLHQMINEIDRDLMYHSDYKKREIVSMLETNAIQNMIKNDTLKDWDGKYENYDKLLVDLVNEFKQQFVWKK